MTVARRTIRQPGEPAGDLAEHLGVNDPVRQQRYRAALARVRAAEVRAEAETEAVRLH